MQSVTRRVVVDVALAVTTTASATIPACKLNPRTPPPLPSGADHSIEWEWLSAVALPGCPRCSKCWAFLC